MESSPTPQPTHAAAIDPEEKGSGDGTFDVLFVGTGVSIGVPNLGHVLEYASAPPESSRDGPNEDGSLAGYDGKPRRCEVGAYVRGVVWLGGWIDRSIDRSMGSVVGWFDRSDGATACRLTDGILRSTDRSNGFVAGLHARAPGPDFEGSVRGLRAIDTFV